ncbi:hypothetical protein Q8G39_28915, partial [Klebsiella pneumoniae]|uniref:hypothetical protein n=1 Tax=Klebsiella pneumoniae TaxID=573 RepID=UPI003013C0EC
KGQDLQQTGQQFQTQVAADAQSDQLDAQTKLGVANLNDDTKKEITAADNDTALQITGAKIAEAERAGKNAGLGGV